MLQKKEKKKKTAGKMIDEDARLWLEAVEKQTLDQVIVMETGVGKRLSALAINQVPPGVHPMGQLY